MNASSPRVAQDVSGTPSPVFANYQYSHVHWATPGGTGQASSASPASPVASGSGASGSGIENGSLPQGSTSTIPTASTNMANFSQDQAQQSQSQSQSTSQQTAYLGQPSNSAASGNPPNFSMPSGSSIPMLDTTGLISLNGPAPLVLPTGSAAPVRPTGVDEDGEGDDELLPAMADDDYSAQLSWQSQSKDNLKILMENFSPAQYDRFEAYRRHALPKQAVRKVIQQSLGQQVSQPVAQIVAGFAKVFVGEIVEKARVVQARRRETGPLSPDHLREAYRMYQEETGRVGAARPIRSKKLFVR
ncbi:hTAFII28-like protein conserved region-domain-containing protein [Collybia nuda]|uniref:Transcription initiation factor TFIID subunit 11 n=1 Tax=Collybia nuda TaxID=64659 RepID=A0A9P5YDD7_9AGAR|nr:hTAFII28-like protein conserved region-domain-containing protein [Collybia nuda]